MTFTGFPLEAVEFYEGLEADNSKAYWQAHRDVYERAVLAPFHELADELEAEFGGARFFRPNRDVRFSADKSPYKTQAGAMLDGGGYVQLSSAGLGVGAGYYMIEPDRLAALRAAIADDRTGPQVEAIVADLRRAGAEVRARDELRTAPRGYPKDHPRIELLRYKGIAMMKTWPVGAWLGTRKAKDRVVTTLRAGVPLNQWLLRNVG